MRERRLGSGCRGWVENEGGKKQEDGRGWIDVGGAVLVDRLLLLLLLLRLTAMQYANPLRSAVRRTWSDVTELSSSRRTHTQTH